MPTGYTAGIIDGTTKDFKDYAKLCMRAFGATMHMRDDSFSEKYREAKPSKYHIEKLEALREQKRELAKTDDATLLEKTRKKLEIDYKDNLKRIEKTKNIKIKLERFLQEAISYEEPTTEHEEIKSFMIEQLKSTLAFDADYSFYEKSNLQIKAKLNNLNATVIRLEKLRDIEKDITYHLKSNKQEIERCEKANLWVLNFLHSLGE